VLLRACEDYIFDVRQAAVQALAGCVDEGTVRAALLAACNDNVQEVCQAAVHALENRIVLGLATKSCRADLTIRWRT
jgi:hypothetical protein